MDKINYALESFKNIQDLIKFADQKAGAVLIVVGLIFTAFVQYLEKLTFSTDNVTTIGTITFLTGLATLICMIVVLYYSVFKILKPRFAKNYQEGELSTFYFEHISKVNKELHVKYENISDEDMLKDIIDQQIEVSHILNEKNENLAKSFIWLFAALFASMVFIILSIQL
jgi:Ca2+/Na+ antiporter